MRSGSILRQLVEKRKMATLLKALPFKLSREEADKLFARNASIFSEGKGIGKLAGLVTFQGDPISTGYLPFHSAAVWNLSAIYDAEYGINEVRYRTVTKYVDNKPTVVVEPYIHINWFSVAGELPPTAYPLGTPQTQIYAGFDLPRTIVENALQTCDILKAKNLTEEKLTHEGKQVRVFPHEMNMSYALEHLSSRLYHLERDRAESFLLSKHRADHIRIRAFETRLDKAEFTLHSYYVAAYIYEKKSGSYTSHSVLNAYNGYVSGNHILSVANTSLAGAIVGAAAGIALGLSTPYALPAQLLYRMAIGSSLSAAFSAVYAYWHNASLDFDFIETKKEQNENHRFPESGDDINRREYAANANRGHEYTHNAFYKTDLPKTKCELLGLDPTKAITPEQIDAAYKKQMRKWHPDLFRSKNADSQRYAEEMSKQINIARDELNSILKPKQ